MIFYKNKITKFLNRNIYYFGLILLLTFSINSHASKDCYKVKNKRAIRLYESGMRALARNTKIDRREAFKLFREAIKEEPKYAAAHFQIAEYKRLRAMNETKNLYNRDRNFASAVKSYLKTIKYCPKVDDYSSYFYIAYYYYYITKDFEQAKNYAALYIEKSNEKKLAKLAADIIKHIDTYNELKSHPVAFNPKRVEGVCTEQDEFLPMITPDGEYAFFTHRYAKHEKGNVSVKWVDEFTSSKRKDVLSSNPVFYPGQAMTKPFNDGRNQGAISVTIDNKTMYLTICQFTKFNGKPYKNCDIFVSKKINGQWTTPQNLGPNINARNTWEGQPSISADGKTLYFASARPNGYGGIDIYYSKKNKTGQWLKAKNIGKVINTQKDDKSPFIHSDSHTLYFASNGGYGMGGFDIYYSRYKNGKWGEPKNIGYPINTKKDDLGFIVSLDGKKAYFSSNNLSTDGGWDIYSFDLYEKVRPKEVLFLKGQLKDDSGKAITDAKIEVKNSKTQEVTEGIIDKETGKYALAVSVNKQKDEKLLLTVKKKDYSFTSKLLTPKKVKLNNPININMEMKPIEVGKKVQINDIHFATNSAIFDKSSMFILNNFIEFLNENPTVKIKIYGHTDNVGDAKSNLILSQKRAKAVRDYLIIMGIDSDRIVGYKGFGETQPKASNKTAKGRAINRRTEFEIISK
ncbi:MAG: hypothetical protein DRI94_11320 [Bacteroidetes bacterium]|nr:MAG: hypothetical protein DRI94_11320 [Bacteroidota bacterium]